MNTEQTLNSNSNPILSLIMPAYNEEEGIQSVLDDTKKSLEASRIPWEILVIDNCSSDQTPKKVLEFKGEDPRIHLIRHDHNKLYSGSCRTGLAAAKGQFIAIMDSDGQFVASDLPKMIDRLKKSSASLVFGWRRYRQDSIFRKAMSWFFNAMGKFWLGFPLHDLNSGIRVMDRKLANIVKIEHSINMVNPELYAFAKSSGLQVSEIEVDHFERRGGKTSHDLKKLGKILIHVNQYMKDLYIKHIKEKSKQTARA